MDINCEKCGSLNVSKGKLAGFDSEVVFISNDSKVFKRKASTIAVYACKDCGCIFRLELENPEKI